MLPDINIEKRDIARIFHFIDYFSKLFYLQVNYNYYYSHKIDYVINNHEIFTSHYMIVIFNALEKSVNCFNCLNFNSNSEKALMSQDSGLLVTYSHTAHCKIMLSTGCKAGDLTTERVNVSCKFLFSEF